MNETNASLLDHLLELERQGWKSLCDGSAHEYYASVMTDEGMMVLANGMTMSREEVAEALAHAPPWSDYEIRAPKLIRLHDAAAALVYTGTGYRAAGDSFTAVMTSVYVCQNDQWRLALYTQTPMQDG